MRPLHVPHASSVGVSYIPIPVQVLAIGDKFVLPTIVPTCSLEKSLNRLGRAAHIACWVSQNSSVLALNTDNSRSVLPSKSLPSDFSPPTYEWSNTFVRWRDKILDAYRRKLKFAGRKSFYFQRAALAWLRRQHREGSCCKVTADKGYGPSLIQAKELQEQYHRDFSSSCYVQISVDDYCRNMCTVLDWCKPNFEAAAMKGLISEKT